MCLKVVFVSKNLLEYEKLETLLEKEGFSVFHITDISKKSLGTIKQINPHVVLLELDLGFYDGIDICYQLKFEKKLSAFIVIHSSRPEEYVQIAAFKAGADDYLIKPINNRILLRKIKALTKRFKSEFTCKKDTIVHNNIVIDESKHLVYLEQQKFYLPKKEFKLLCLLVKNPKKTFSREEIYQNVWGAEIFNPRVIDVHVRKIREKLGNKVIKTIKGYGYQLAN